MFTKFTMFTKGCGLMSMIEFEEPFALHNGYTPEYNYFVSNYCLHNRSAISTTRRKLARATREKVKYTRHKPSISAAIQARKASKLIGWAS